MFAGPPIPQAMGCRTEDLSKLLFCLTGQTRTTSKLKLNFQDVKMRNGVRAFLSAFLCQLICVVRFRMRTDKEKEMSNRNFSLLAWALVPLLIVAIARISVNRKTLIRVQRGWDST